MSDREQAVHLLNTVLGRYETLGSVPDDWHTKVSQARDLLTAGLPENEIPALGVQVDDKVEAIARFG